VLLTLNADTTGAVSVARIDLRIFILSIALATIGALVASVPPVFHALSDQRRPAPGTSRSFGSRRVTRFRTAVIVGQNGVCVALLICGGLLVRTFVRSSAIEPGYPRRARADGGVPASTSGLREHRAARAGRP